MKNSLLFFLLLFIVVTKAFSQSEISYEENYRYQKNQVNESLDKAIIIVEGVVERQEYGFVDGEIVTFSYIKQSNSFKNRFSNKSLCLITKGGEWNGYVVSYSHGEKLYLGEKGIVALDSVEVKGNVVYSKLGYFSNRFFTNNGTKEHFTKYFYPYRHAQKLAFEYQGIETESFDGTNICLKIDNLSADLQNLTVNFDILAKSNFQVPLSKIIANCKYPTGNLGNLLVQNSKIEITLYDSLNSNVYFSQLNDINDTTLQIRLLTATNAGISNLYKLKSTYTKLFKVSLKVQNWGNLGNLNIEDFDLNGQAYYRDRDDVPFDDLCVENGTLNFGLCEILSIHTAPFAAGIKQVIELKGVGFGSSGTISIPNADTGGSSSFTINSTDSRYINNWQDNSITINITDLTPMSPMGGGEWKVTAASTFQCSTDVKIDYSISSQFVQPNSGTGVEKMVSIATELVSGGDKIKWYFDRISFDISTKFAAQGITSSQVLSTLQQVFCDWETATGLEIFYAGESTAGQDPTDGNNVIELGI